MQAFIRRKRVNGKLVSEWDYYPEDYVEFIKNSDHFELGDIERWGDGYRSIFKYSDNGVGGVWSAESFGGRIIAPPGMYDFIDGFNHGYARVAQKANSLRYIMNKYGELVPSQPDDKLQYWGLIDEYGNQVVPIVYKGVRDFFKKNADYTVLFANGNAWWFDFMEPNKEERCPVTLKGFIAIREERNYWENHINNSYSAADAFDGCDDASLNYDMDEYM